MRGRDPTAGPRGWFFAALATAGLLLVGSAPLCRAAQPPRHAASASQTGLQSPASADYLIETAELLPTYATYSDGHGHVLMPGVNSVRRVVFDPVADRTVGLQLALAEPLVVYSHPDQGANHPPRIALTFDDGPSATYTPQMLDIFARNGAHCTFFVLGGLVAKNKQLIGRMQAEGNEVGIHSWWHANLTGLSDTAIASDLARCQAALDPLLTQPVRWMRPPYGAHNARVRAAINNAGYHVALWSVDPRDWTTPGSSVVASRVLSHARDGAVVVMHDGGGNRAGTVAAMRTVVPELLRRGFQLVTMSELAGLAEAPPTERGMALTIDDHRYVVENAFEDMRVLVDGVEVPLGTPPVRTEGQFLVHGRPVLAALGIESRWDPTNLAVSFDAPRGRFVIRLNTLEVSRNDEPIFVRVPSVYYHDLGLLPVWLIANACGASVQVDEEARTIQFFTTVAAEVGATPPRSAASLALRGLDGMDIYGRPAESWMKLGLAALGAHASVII